MGLHLIGKAFGAAAALAALETGSIALATDLYSYDDAARLLSKEILNIDGVTNVKRRGAEELIVKNSDGTEVTVYLGNLLATLNSDPDSSNDHVTRFAKTLADTLVKEETPRPGELRRMLFPMVRHSGYIDHIKSAAGDGSKADAFVIAPIAADYWLVLGLDSPEFVKVAERETLTELSMSDAELIAQAKANFESRLTDVSIADGGVRMPILDGASEVSILAINSFWHAQAKELGGTIVAVAPSRDTLMYCAASDARCIEWIGKSAVDYVNTLPNAVSSALIEWTGEGWAPYAP